MSNERIDLTQLENQYKERIEHNSLYASDPDKEDDLFVISDLIAELKRCYEELDFLQINVIGAYDDNHWIATCKPDGEGQCTMMIEGYKELMRLDKEGKIEIPEYFHQYDELLLYECECGVTHEEWLESKN